MSLLKANRSGGRHRERSFLRLVHRGACSSTQRWRSLSPGDKNERRTRNAVAELGQQAGSSMDA